ncbi:RluA family pseudouridine synthase [Oscillospiraceae bacterium MB08-C2-2]|nr:RluA family pseudouridine synthase [Oscillospiraceae bacterium MB08-C2-2]
MNRFNEKPLWLAAQAKDSGCRMDKWISDQLPDISRSMAQKLCDDGLVLVEGKAVGKNYRILGNETVEVILPAPAPSSVEAQDIPLDIVYEDADLLVVNKPKGMVVHPAPGHSDGTLVNALLYHCGEELSGIGGVTRPGIVHRIDKDTSGLLMVAKNDFAHQGLSAQISEHSFLRQYRAVVYGGFKTDSGTVDAPIGRHPKDRKKMCVTDRGSREAVTHYRVLDRYRGFSDLEVRLETGRTHQIRVHLAYLGHPVAGDEVYGPAKVITQLGGQCLHAQMLGFIHPRSGQNMEFSSELPEYYTAFLRTLPGKD